MFAKIRPMLALSVALSLFNGCWWDSSSSPAAPTISGLSVSPSQVAKTGDGSKIVGTLGIETETATVSYKVTNSTGDVSSKFTIKGIASSISGATTLAGSIVATSAADGNYTFVLTVTDADGQVASQSAGFSVATELVSSGSVTLGAQSSKNGSFLQLTGSAVQAWTSGAGKPVADIYVVFGQDASGALSLMSPDAADGDGFTLDWTTINSAKLLDLGSTLPTSKADVATAMATTTSEKVAATAGHYYGVKYGSSYSVIYITSINPATRSADASVTIYQ